jgi:hypothetical protein
MKYNIGCNDKKLVGYINCDINQTCNPDVVCSADDLPVEDDTLDEIRLDAVYEHLYLTQRKRALKHWFAKLKKGGKLVVNWIPNTEVGILLYMRHLNADSVREDWCVGCGPTKECPHWDLTMLERLTNGAVGLHNEQPYQVHKGIFSTQKVLAELLESGFGIEFLGNKMYPGESGEPYNICFVARKE